MADLFPAHTTETAPEEARPALAAALNQLGFVPTMMAKFAEAPLLLQAYQTAAAFFDKTSFSPTERLVVLLTASYLNNCGFCMSAHSWGAGRQGLDADVIAALRGGCPLADTRLEALRLFVRALVLDQGAVPEPERQAFFAAGFTSRQALEAVLGVATKVMTNHTNALARTPPNPEFGDAVGVVMLKRIVPRTDRMTKPSKFAKQYGPWAVVTGASSGIGAEFALHRATEGFDVVLAARREAMLRALAEEIEQRFGVETRCVVVDLSEEPSVDALVAQVQDLDVGLVVSNAGTGQPGHFLEQDHREQLTRFRLNALSHLNIAYAFGARLAQRGGGGMILGGAMGAALGIPFSSCDAGSKALVQSLGESLHIELKRKRIQVMTLVVPPTNTAIITKFGLDPADMPMKPMSVEQCVSEALRHFKQGRSLSLPGALNRLLSQIVPTGVMRVMMGKMIEQTLAKDDKRDGRAGK